MTSDSDAIVGERLRARGGRIELLGEHLARLFADEEGGASSPKAARLEEQVVRHFDGAGRRDGVLDLLRIARGNYGYSTLHDPEFDGERLAEGLRLLHAGARPPLPGRKEAPSEYVRERSARAAEQDFDELIWCGPDGALFGATAMNLFLVRGATLVTPSLASGAWPGILRRAVLIAARQLAAELRITVSEERLLPADLARADDAFLASSALGIVAIASIDGRPLPAPPRGSPARALVPKLRLRVHELCRERFLPSERPAPE